MHRTKNVNVSNGSAIKNRSSRVVEGQNGEMIHIKPMVMEKLKEVRF